MGFMAASCVVGVLLGTPRIRVYLKSQVNQLPLFSPATHLDTLLGLLGMLTLAIVVGIRTMNNTLNTLVNLCHFVLFFTSLNFLAPPSQWQSLIYQLTLVHAFSGIPALVQPDIQAEQGALHIFLFFFEHLLVMIYPIWFGIRRGAPLVRFLTRDAPTFRQWAMQGVIFHLLVVVYLLFGLFASITDENPFYIRCLPKKFRFFNDLLGYWYPPVKGLFCATVGISYYMVVLKLVARRMAYAGKID